MLRRYTQPPHHFEQCCSRPQRHRQRKTTMLMTRLSRLGPAAPFHVIRSRLAPRVSLRPSQQQRGFRVAPPYLLDDYIPRYQLISSIDAARKRSEAYAHPKNYNLCPRLCNVNRFQGTGFCMTGANVKIATIAPHFGEEPCIQGHYSSGSVFFSGCNLRCVFCQNHDIAHTRSGFDLEPEELAEWYVKLQDEGKVNNINLVTPEHVVLQLVLSILHARELGLRIPIMYNNSSFDSRDSIKFA